MRVSPLLKRLVVVGLVVAALVAVRVMLEPRIGPLQVVHLPPAARAPVARALDASAVDRSALLTDLGSKRVLLIGEAHFQQEPQAWLQALLRDLHARDGRAAVLLLELPGSLQPALDSYLATGNDSVLDKAFKGSEVLPYKSTVRWARLHPDAVAAVRADDEASWHIGLMRLLLTDTRNETMARAIAAAARAFPDRRVVAYGGRLHMMNAGRYMYDSETRRPIGARLPAMGIGRSDIAAVWLLAGEAPFDGVWREPASVRFAGPAGELPINGVQENPIFGAERLRDIADYAVHLGAATPIARD